MDRRLLEIVVCPVCGGKLEHRSAQKELVCRADRLAYPIEDGLPVMLEDEARRMSLEELDRKAGA
jgi:uncharacterized protein YbaR (Trm112 family)